VSSPKTLEDERRARRAGATTRVLRAELEPFGDDEIARMTPAERMAMVWQLTLECLAWTGADADELRLQRSVCRVERRRRWVSHCRCSRTGRRHLIQNKSASDDCRTSRM